MADAKRTELLRVRLTPGELALLKEQSVRTGRSMSDLIRAAWKRMKVIELPPADFADTVVQLRRIGNNLNQLTRAANEGDFHVPEIRSTLSEIVALDRELSKIMSGGAR